MEKIRGFEVAKGFEDKEINLPVRKTKFSAGYDIEAAEEVVVPSFKKGMNPTLIKTGIKAYMQDDEVLEVHVRSSIGIKKGLMLMNTTGIIDSDFYSNEDNDGNIHFKFRNLTNKEVIINAGERVIQGIFKKYLVADNDVCIQKERKGGIGHTNK